MNRWNAKNLRGAGLPAAAYRLCPSCHAPNVPWESHAGADIRDWRGGYRGFRNDSPGPGPRSNGMGARSATPYCGMSSRGPRYGGWTADR